jgi:hypothetical protein
MRKLLLIAALALPLPAGAEDNSGDSLLQQGARLLMEGLLQEMEPALRELEGLAGELEPALRDFALEMGPALKDLLGKVEDWSAYHPPEILPNGDIILRRKTPEERDTPKDGEIDL